MKRRAAAPTRTSVSRLRVTGVGVLACLRAAWLRAETLTLGKDEIPPLQPPRGEMPPGFWEAHGGTVAGIACLLVVAAVIAWWVRARARPPVPVPPEALAHASLESLRGRPEDPVVLSQVARAVRGYFVSALGLPQAEPTSRELARCLQTDERVGPELAGATSRFLERCEQRQFAPRPAAGELGAVDQALDLVDQAAARERARRAAAQEGAARPGGPGGEGAPETGSAA